MPAIKIEGKFGYGTMSLTWTPNPTPLDKAIESLTFVTSHPEFGTKLINGAEFYGPDNRNLKLLKAFVDTLEPKEAKALTISIKGGFNTVTNKPEGSKASISKSVANINSFFPKEDAHRPTIVFEVARVDATVPYENTIGYIADYVKSGDIDGISLSEVGVGSIRKAISVSPIACVEVEFSLMFQDIIHNGVLDELAQHGVPVVAYSPLGRGYLTDYQVETTETWLGKIPEDDIRKHQGWFTQENYKKNYVLTKKLYDFAHSVKNTSLESLSLSWILKVSESVNFHGIKKVPKILPIPSGSTKARITSNLGNVVELTDADLKQIEQIIAANPVQGNRYSEHHDDLSFA